MPIRLNSTGGGAVSIDVPSTASTFTLTAPARTGNIITSADSGTVTGTMIAAGTVTTSNLVQPLTLMTAQNSTSGTFIDFTGIPSWARRITLMFNGVSTNGTSVPQIQIGTSAGIQTSGYAGSGGIIYAGFSPYGTNFTSGFGLSQTGQWGATVILSGSATISLLDSSNGTWVTNGWFAREDAPSSCYTGGKKTLSGTLDRVRITTVNGTDAFDAGSINVMYE